MTTSIVFDASLTCTDIESDNTLDPTQTDMLTDPTAPRDALQGLRYLKTRETGNDIVTPNIVGRSTGQFIPYTGNQDPSYFEYKMRRKAEVVMSYNKERQSTNSNYAYFAKSGKSKYRSMTNARIKALKESQQCETMRQIEKPASNSGVFGDKSTLIFDPHVPYFDKL